MSGLTSVDVNEIFSSVPRTLYHIQMLDDDAISSKWLLSLPDPNILEQMQKTTDTAQKKDSTTYLGIDMDKLIGNIKSAANEFQSAFIGSKPIMLRAMEVELPLPKIDTEQIEVQGRKIDMPAGSSTSSFNCTFLESKDFTVTKYFQAWMNCVYNPSTGVYGLPYHSSGYGFARDLNLYVFDTVGIQVGKGKLYGCFPTGISGLKFDSKLQLIKVSVDFSIQTSEWVETSGILKTIMSTAVGLYGAGKALKNSEIGINHLKVKFK